MSKQFPLVALQEVLEPVSRPEPVDPLKEYSLLGIRLDGRGPFLREALVGSQSSAKNLFKIKESDFIYSRLFAWRGAFGIIEQSLNGCYVSSEFPTFKPKNEEIDIHFLKYWFRLPTTLDIVLADCTGSTPLTRNRFKENYFLALQIPLPPLEEQQRIVARIESLAAKIEEARELRKKTVEEAEALLDSTLSKILKKNENNPTWETGPMPMFVLINPSRKGAFVINRPSEVSFIPMSAVDGVTGKIIRPETKHLDDVIKGYTYFEEGDVIFARITPCMQNAKSALAKGLKNRIGFGSTEFHVLRPKEKILGEWLHHLVRHKEFRDDAATHFKGTAGQQRVPQKFLENKIIPVPQKDEQHRIVAYLDGFQSKVESLKRLQEETSKELDALLPSILDKAFKGEL